MPADIPVTRPVPEPIVAIEGREELHTPPPVAVVSTVEPPEQTNITPVITPGEELTVIDFVAKHPVGNVYEIVAMPDVIPVTIPDNEPAVAMAGEPELQAPPVLPSISVTVAPMQTVPKPSMGVGKEFTVTKVVTKQPAPAE